jgi:hypothetical protein
VAEGTHDQLLATSERYREVLARAAAEEGWERRGEEGRVPAGSEGEEEEETARRMARAAAAPVEA